MTAETNASVFTCQWVAIGRGRLTLWHRLGARAVAALGDEDEQLRWLAALSLLGIGGATVIATLQAFIAQAPSAVAREEAEKVLAKLTEEK